MITIQKYVRAQSLEEAWQLNQNKRNRILGGMLWLRLGKGTVNTAIDLCDLGLNTIEETQEQFSIGAMATLRDIEKHEGLNAYLFAQLPESKIRSWKAGRFSFNNSGGRCEECSGNGYKTIQMHFLPNVYVPCEVCGGQRYNRETLEARFKGKSIADVLDMTINQAVEFFDSQPYILKKIKTLQDVGLGYIKLGQSSTTLSGGESQRVKLATELARPGTGKTLYILDEPTTGLHFEDVRVLMGVLRRLVDKGNTVIIIEHNPDVIRSCDYLIDMGLDGGRDGGTVVATGTIDDIRNNPKSITGRYI